MVKRVKLLAAVFSLSSIGLHAQTPYFHYFNGEKKYWTTSPNKVVVQFAENADTSTMRRSISSVSKTGSKELNVVSFAESDTAQTRTLLKQWKNKNEILFSSPVFINEQGKEIAALTNRITVRLKQESDYPLLLKSLEPYLIDTIRQRPFDNQKYSVSLNYASEKDAMQVSNELYETNLFDFVEPVFLLFIEQHGNTIPNDTYFPDQWNLLNTGQYGGIPGMDIRATKAWGITTGDSTVIISIVEFADVNIDHPDLKDNILSGSNGYGDHSTACVGIAGAKGNNSMGICGVAYDCKILPITVLQATSASIVDAIDLAVQKGAKVLSMSWGMPSFSIQNITDINNAINNAYNSGCVLVSSAGNGNSPSVSSPANGTTVLAVGAISPCGERKSPTSCDGENWGSDYGPQLTVMAPGVLIPTTDARGYNNGYNPQAPFHTIKGGNLLSSDYSDWDYTVWFEGTSAACPHVSGIVGLMFSVNPNLTPLEIRNILERTARKVRPDLYNYNQLTSNGLRNNEMGFGLVDAHAAVYMAKYGVKPPPTAMIRDNEDDNGIEPNPTTESTWDSPDIWVRHLPDNIQVHQNPRLGANHIYVRVKNVGNIPFQGNKQLFLYWAKADTSLGWYAHWMGMLFPQNNMPMGNLIGSKLIPRLEVFKDTILVIPWNNAPNPANYSAIANNPWHFYLLARIAQTSVNGPMTYPETNDVFGNVKNNNKIALKHVNIGNGVDLIIRDTKDDTDAEPNPTPNKIVWNSPDIWVRNTNDGGLEHQNPVPNNTNYVYVRIKNVGNMFSQGNEELELYWSKTATAFLWNNHWAGNSFAPGGPLIGNRIVSQPIPVLQPGKDTILKIPWYVPDTLAYKSFFQKTVFKVIDWHFALLARIKAVNDPMTYTEKIEDLHYNVRHNNNIACKNISIIERSPYNFVGATAAMRNVYNHNQVRYFLDFKADREEHPSPSYFVWSNINITIEFDSVLFQVWKRSGSPTGTHFINLGMQTFRIFLDSAGKASSPPLLFLPNEVGLFNLRFGVSIPPHITPDTSYTFHVIQRELLMGNTKDNIIGGKVYQINILSPTRGTEASKESYTDIDTNTNTEREIKPNKIVSVLPNPATDQITVLYELNEAQNASIAISNYYFTGNSDSYVLDINTQSKTFNIQNYPTGVYVITLICDGQVADVKTFVKQ